MEPSTNSRKVARFVRKARLNSVNPSTDRAYTQEVFARRIGISRGFLSEIESGTKSISVDTLVRIARRLDTTPSAILGF